MKDSNGTKSNIKLIILSIVMFLLGSLIFFYPTLRNYVANKQFQSAIGKYEQKVAEIPKKDLSRELEKAVKYNNQLNGII